MAKRKKQKKTSSRRRKMSGVKMSAGIQQAAMVIAGYAGGQLLANAVENITKKTIDPKIKGAALLAAGLFGPKLLKMNSPMVKDIALGVAVRGGVNLLGAFGIAGLGAVTQRYYLPMAQGPGVPSGVSGTPIKRTVNGTPAQAAAYLS